MAYKDKQKQKEATKERTRRYRARQKASQSGGVTRLDGNALVDKFHDKAQHNFDKLIKEQGLADLEKCRYCGESLPALSQPRKYPGACGPCAWKQPNKPIDTRGKGIKCFEDLPPDVQQSIETMSKSIDAAGIRDYEDEKAARTERAIHYQHLFPDRYQSRGIA